jgi:lysophospholipid hydrolase
MWLEFYCNVTNITKNGIAESLVQGRAGDSIGASMSYVGVVPPMCVDGDMLVDGCYSSNLPVRRARHLGANTIFIVDVSTLTNYNPQHYGYTVSGWKLLYDKWNPFRKGNNPGPPSYSELIERLAQTTSLSELEISKNLPGCYYISIPVTNYKPEEFAKFDEIFDAGYNFSRRWLKEMEISGKFPDLSIQRTDYLPKHSCN